MKRVEIVRDDLKRYFMLWNIDAQEYISDLVTFEPLHFASFDDAKRYAKAKELRKQRGGSKIYYDREKNRVAQRDTRNYKQTKGTNNEM